MSMTDRVRTSLFAGPQRSGSRAPESRADGDESPREPSDSVRAGAPVRRKRRRRRRVQGDQAWPQVGRNNVQPDGVSRERIFQDLEGLLRRIREQAEEYPAWVACDLTELAHSVSGFGRFLEGQAEPLSERTRTEYLRLRERLSSVLREPQR